MILKEGPYRGSMIFEVPSIFHCWALKNTDKLDPELSKGYIDWLKAREGRIKVNEKRFTRQLLQIRYREYDEYFLNQPRTKLKPPAQSGSLISKLFSGGKDEDNRQEMVINTGGADAKSGV